MGKSELAYQLTFAFFVPFPPLPKTPDKRQRKGKDTHFQTPVFSIPIWAITAFYPLAAP